MSEATFPRKRLGATPMEQRNVLPSFSRMACLIARASFCAFSTGHSRPMRRHAISSIETTAVTGTHICLASLTPVPVRMPTLWPHSWRQYSRSYRPTSAQRRQAAGAVPVALPAPRKQNKSSNPGRAIAPVRLRSLPSPTWRGIVSKANKRRNCKRRGSAIVTIVLYFFYSLVRVSTCGAPVARLTFPPYRQLP